MSVAAVPPLFRASTTFRCGAVPVRVRIWMSQNIDDGHWNFKTSETKIEHNRCELSLSTHDHSLTVRILPCCSNDLLEFFDSRFLVIVFHRHILLIPVVSVHCSLSL